MPEPEPQTRLLEQPGSKGRYPGGGMRKEGDRMLGQHGRAKAISMAAVRYRRRKKNICANLEKGKFGQDFITDT